MVSFSHSKFDRIVARPAGRRQVGARVRLLNAVLIAVAACPATFCQTYTISTFAGGGLPTNLAGTSANLDQPSSVAVDSAGNVFFAEPNYNAVFRLDAKTNIITVAAGSGAPGFSGDNGPATAAQLYAPQSVALDSAGNLFIADADNSRVRKVSSGTIATIASTPLPWAITFDVSGNLYITDGSTYSTYKVSNGIVTTIAGKNQPPGFGGDNGPAMTAEFNLPDGVAVDVLGNVYIADTLNQRIRKIANGIITTIAGNGTAGFAGDNGPASSDELNFPNGITLDSNGILYVADTVNNRIRKIANGTITTVAGNGTQGFGGDNGPPLNAALNHPLGIAVDPAGNLYTADAQNNRIRKIANGKITTIAGNGTPHYGGDNGPATAAILNLDLYGGLAVDPAGDLYIADKLNNCIRKVVNGVITTVAGTGVAGFTGDNGPATSAELNSPTALAVDAAGNLYIVDTPISGSARCQTE